MRLTVLDHGHRLRARLFLGMTARMSRTDSPDIVRMLLYRPEFLTRALLELTAPAMRGPSYWTAGEREYLAMRTAERLQCTFCQVTHTELTRIAADGEIDPADPTSARPQVHEIQRFLEAPGPVDLPREAVLQALHVGLVWNIVNRLANAFSFELKPRQLQTGTRSLHRFGYRFPAFLLAGGSKESHGGLVENVRYAVFEAPGATTRELRKAAADGNPESWDSYCEMVRDCSHRITDADVDALKAAGHSEDAIFEVTVAATVGAALRSFETGRLAIQD